MAMEIDCSVWCPMFLKMLNSCPSRNFKLGITEMTQDDLFEIGMVCLSTTPYLCSFLFLIATTYFKTTRAAVVLVMIFFQNFVIEFLKNALRDPRPNYSCNKQFGNPSNHATFFTGLIVWLIMEFIILEKKYRFAHTLAKLTLVGVYPFIIYSRIHLNYHTPEQVIFFLINYFRLVMELFLE